MHNWEGTGETGSSEKPGPGSIPRAEGGWDRPTSPPGAVWSGKPRLFPQWTEKQTLTCLPYQFLVRHWEVESTGVPAFSPPCPHAEPCEMEGIPSGSMLMRHQGTCTAICWVDLRPHL